MIFEHFRDSPLVLETRNYEQSIHFKPRGLWLSILGEDDWPTWCRSEGFRLERLEDKSTITLGGPFRILRISTEDELRLFTKLYGVQLHPALPDCRHPDWARVAEEYDGMIISPLLWRVRYEPELSWYSSWDVDSGCIWNTKAIASINGHPQTFEELERRMALWLDIRVERLNNLRAFGTEDPTGGAGRQLYPINHPMFPKE